MLSSTDLKERLRSIDGRGYKSYRSLAGVYEFPGFVLAFDSIQGDPFASPSRLSAWVEDGKSNLPAEYLSSRTRIIATADFLTRVFHAVSCQVARGSRGTGNSGEIRIEVGGQQILERNSFLVDHDTVEARFTLGLPASGRTVLARQAEEMIFQELPEIIRRALYHENLDAASLRRHVETAEDQECLRRQLPEHGLVAFIGNGSVLPRRSGVDDRILMPTRDQPVVPFISPRSLERTLQTPNRGAVAGMGIPAGITLIVGGGFHGKSTLLRALEKSVYNHVPGDGRETVVTLASACKIRSEDGRSIAGVDISPFIDRLPFGRSTEAFSTDNASGSSSQAANIIEAVEMGSKLLLIDEDTSATNFMIRDARMQELVPGTEEPITPLIDRSRALLQDTGVSLILVMGGSGDYFDVADEVIRMDAYTPLHVTERARAIASALPSRRTHPRDGTGRLRQQARYPDPSSFDPRRGRSPATVKERGLATLLFGRTVVDLSGLEQLVEKGQTRAIGQAILRFAAKNGHCLREGLSRLEDEMDRAGLDSLSEAKVGNLVRPRLFEIGSAINRMRTLRIRSRRNKRG